MKTLRVDYYQVSPRGATAAAAEALRRTSERPLDDPLRSLRTEDGRGLLLHECDRFDGRLGANFVSVDLEEGARRANPRGEIENIRFGADEGIAMEAVLALEPGRNLVALQRSRSGATAGAICRYFHRIHDLEGFGFLPIPTRSAARRYGSMKDYKRVEVTIASGIRGGIVAGSGDSIDRALALAEACSAPQVTLIPTVGRSWSQRLRKRGVADLVRALRRRLREDQTVTKLVVGGLGEHDEPEVVDFVMERLKDALEVEPDEARVVSFQRRAAAVARALNEKLGGIDDLLR